MFLRFVVEAVDEDSLVRQGVVQAAHGLKDDLAVLEADRQVLDRALRWLDDHLPLPTRFNRTTSKGYYRRRTVGISWLKDTARDHLGRMRELSQVLERYGQHVSVLKDARPGYVVYEDEFQVVAEPFADTSR